VVHAQVLFLIRLAAKTAVVLVLMACVRTIASREYRTRLFEANSVLERLTSRWFIQDDWTTQLTIRLAGACTVASHMCAICTASCIEMVPGPR